MNDIIIQNLDLQVYPPYLEGITLIILTPVGNKVRIT
jgi:hypothetical protein